MFFTWKNELFLPMKQKELIILNDALYMTPLEQKLLY